MPRLPTIEVIAGTAIKLTFVSSGAVPSNITSALLDQNEVCISSLAAVGSVTNFYALHQLPNTPGWYINEWKATIQGLNYVNRQFLRLRTLES
jgi:hypothetical protein